MIRCMLRSGISRSLSAFILIFMIAFLYIYPGIREELKFFGQQEKYISDKAPTGFFEQLTADRDTAPTFLIYISITSDLMTAVKMTIPPPTAKRIYSVCLQETINTIRTPLFSG